MGQFPYKPTTDKVILKELELERNSVIVLPDNSRPEIAKCEVMAVGPGRLTTSGWMPLMVKVGDVVYIPRMTSIEIELGGEKLMICSEDRIFCTAEGEAVGDDTPAVS